VSPKLKFQLNISLDIQTGTQFLSRSKAGIDFGAGIVKHYPELTIAQYKDHKEKGEIVREFVEKYYQTNKQELDEALIIMQNNWEEVEDNFYFVVDKIFEGFPWPPGQYVCYLSIFDCNPRFLDTKTFQVYYKSKIGTNHVVAHEMLHFIFYDYVEQKEKDLAERIGKDRLWVLSEVFDKLAFEHPIFEKFKPKFQGGYPEIKTLQDQLHDKLNGQPFTIKKFLVATENTKLT